MGVSRRWRGGLAAAVLLALLSTGGAAQAQAQAQPGGEAGVGQSAPRRPRGRREALAEYHRRFVWFPRLVRRWDDGHRTVRDEGPVRGAAREALEVPLFYDYIGANHLAAAYRSRHRLHWGLWGGGLALSVSGAALFVAGVVLGAGNDDAAPALLISGTAAAAIGINMVTWMAGMIEPDPTRLGDKRRLADEFNARLAEELGLERDPPLPRELPARELSIAPVVTPRGGGITLAVQF